MDWQHGDNDGVIKSLDSAKHLVSIELLNHRVVTHPIEPRGGVAVYHPDADRFTFHVSSQSLHNNRDHIAKALKIKRSQSRWLAPDVGGGFGSKNFGYQEQGLLLWAAKKSGRPVKWIATRSEVFLSDHQVRDHRATARLGLDKEGRFIALEIESIANLGAYIAGSAAGVQTNQYAHLLGPYTTFPRSRCVHVPSCQILHPLGSCEDQALQRWLTSWSASSIKQPTLLEWTGLNFGAVTSSAKHPCAMLLALE